jgi:Spy/CpxP family protein refolding chaperone
LMPVMTDKSLTKEQMLEKINAIHQTTKEQLSKILTPEQMKKYDEMNMSPREDGQEFTERHIERLSEKLNLTEQQKKNFTPIVKNEMKDLLPIMTDKSLTKEQKLEKISAIRQVTKEQLSKILTPEQMKKYTEMNTDTSEYDMQVFTERHIERMSEKLKLTEQQKKDITPIIESEMREMRALTNNKSLTKEQKWEKINAIHQTTKERLSKILTPEQMKKYTDEMGNQASQRNAEDSNYGHNNSRQKPADRNSK